MKIYNQLLNKYSRMGCVGYGIGHLVLFKFGIFVTNNFLLKFLTYFEKLGVWSVTKGASFSLFYNTFVSVVNKKLDINLKVVTKSVNEITKYDTGTRGIGIMEYHSFGTLIDDGVFDKKDVDKFIEKDGSGHHIAWDGSLGGYLINSDGSDPIKCSLDTLNYMYSKGMIWNPVRTIEPVDSKTKDILRLTLLMLKAENKNRLNSFIKNYENVENIDKAKLLFFYGRKENN